MNKIEVCKWWLERCFALVPVQPGTKANVTTFGPKARTIDTIDEARRWFDGNKPINLAVVRSVANLVLDFDDPNLYTLWAEACPQEAQTYTETTPRGGRHVFANIDSPIPFDMILKPGIEIKQSVVVSPSIVNHMHYQRGEGDLITVDPIKVFTPLTVTGTRKPALLAQIQRVTIPHHFGKIADIKQQLPIFSLLSKERPNLKLRMASNGRFMSGLCPIHNDTESSFWIDTERNLFGCHACGVRGDVINLFSYLENITVQEATNRLAARLGL